MVAAGGGWRGKSGSLDFPCYQLACPASGGKKILLFFVWSTEKGLGRFWDLVVFWPILLSRLYLIGPPSLRAGHLAISWIDGGMAPAIWSRRDAG